VRKKYSSCLIKLVNIAHYNIILWLFTLILISLRVYCDIRMKKLRAKYVFSPLTFSKNWN